jgi:alkanesulfonate monooxygenase SsuD/methylene tetrahydromethanopterin reductase-like flavin-dependent oxidoreductase (luciferase family)
MSPSITFGWRVPDWPENGQNSAEFRDSIFHFMDVLQAGGLHSAWVGDHFFPWAADIDQKKDAIEAWTTLTYLMARYPRMYFGTIVLSQSYRPPAALAKMAATAQWLSNGRFILGIGAGWKVNEYEAYGYDFPSDRVRLDQLEEAVQVIRKMWTEEAPTFHGEHYHIDNAYCSPRPNPVPPLLIGGAGPKRTLRIVAKYGDWCNLNNSDVDFCVSRLNTLREHCQAVGRNYDEIVKTYACDSVAVAPTHAEAERQLKASYFGQMRSFAGTPDEVAAQIQPFVDLGITHFILRFVDYPNTASAEMFMKEVMPRFA